MTTKARTYSSTARARESKREVMTAREMLFVAELMKEPGKQAEAAIRAGYSARTASTIAHELLQRPLVKAAVRKAMAEQQKRTLITADRVLLDLQEFGDKALKAGEFSAAIRSRHLLGQHYKLFTEKHEHGGIGGGPVLFQITEKEADL